MAGSYPSLEAMESLQCSVRRVTTSKLRHMKDALQLGKLKPARRLRLLPKRKPLIEPIVVPTDPAVDGAKDACNAWGCSSSHRSGSWCKWCQVSNCTWAKTGSIWLLAFFPQFYSHFWPKMSHASVRNLHWFYSIPAISSDHFSENVLFGQHVISWAVWRMPQLRSLNDLLTCHMKCQRPCFAWHFRKGPNCQERDLVPDFGQILSWTAFSLLNAKCNAATAEVIFRSPKRHRTEGKCQKAK